MEFGCFKFKLVLLGLGSLDFLDDFLFQIIEIMAIRAYIMLTRFIRLITNAFLMVPLKATLTKDHVTCTPIHAITIH